jgi:S-adenosylmethionine:tRNA ribosyltransferase-isomerase
VRPATSPRRAGAPEGAVPRVLVVDAPSRAIRVVPSGDFPLLFEAGDLLVVNDAATVPASLEARTEAGEQVEIRLVSSLDDRRWTAALLGAGDHRTRTEDRPPPPPLAAGARLTLRAALVATIARVHQASSRLVDVELSVEGSDGPDASLAAIWSAIYRAGRPVQYAHVSAPLALWDVQNVYAARPWAVEMPSAGRMIRVQTLLELERRGVEIARVTHAAGLSSIGDANLDAMLPFPERYEVTEETWEAIARARKRGGRIVAIGTSAARALEGGARSGALTGVTDLRIGPGMRRAIVDAVLTGVHEADTTHFALLGAFAAPDVLARVLARAESEGLLGHELGDACLVWGEPRENLPARAVETSIAPVLRRPSSPDGARGARVAGP